MTIPQGALERIAALFRSIEEWPAIEDEADYESAQMAIAEMEKGYRAISAKLATQGEDIALRIQRGHIRGEVNYLRGKLSEYEAKRGT